MGEVLHINLDDNEDRHAKRKAKEPKPEKAELIESEADLDAVFNELMSTCRQDANLLLKLTSGTGFYPALEAVDDLITTLTGGPQTEVCRKYGYLTDPKREDEFLKAEGGTLDFSAKRSLVRFIKMMDRCEKLRNELVQILREQVFTNRALIAFRAIRYKEQLETLYTKDDEKGLEKVYDEFANICSHFSKRSFSDLQIGEFTIGVREAEEQVLKRITWAIEDTPTLKYFLDSATKVNPEGMNLARIYDAQARGFVLYYYGYNDMMETVKSCMKLWQDLYDLKSRSNIDEGQWDGFIDVMSDIAINTSSFFRAAADVVEDFQNKKDEAPFCLLHPNSTMERAVNDSKLPNFYSNILDAGTNHAKIIQNMPRRLEEIALNIARKSVTG